MMTFKDIMKKNEDERATEPLDVKSVCFALGFLAGKEVRQREKNRPICVTGTT
jgi:hypothetical protein